MATVDLNPYIDKMRTRVTTAPNTKQQTTASLTPVHERGRRDAFFAAVDGDISLRRALMITRIGPFSCARGALEVRLPLALRPTDEPTIQPQATSHQHTPSRMPPCKLTTRTSIDVQMEDGVQPDIADAFIDTGSALTIIKNTCNASRLLSITIATMCCKESLEH